MGSYTMADDHTIRVTFKDSIIKIYVDGKFVFQSSSTWASTANSVYFGVEASDVSYAGECKAKYKSFRLTNDGAFAPGSEALGTSDTKSIVFIDSKTFVPVKSWASTVGPNDNSYVVEIDPSYYNVTTPDVASTLTYCGSLTMSSTGMRMPGVKKHYLSVVVSHSPLEENELISCYYEVDGVSYDCDTLTDTEGTTTSVFPVDTQGDTIRPTICLWTENTLAGDHSTLKGLTSPTVYGVTLRYNPIGTSRHVYTFDCRESAEDNSGRLWNSNPEDAIGFLFDACRNRSKLTVVSCFDTYSGTIEEVEFSPAPYSTMHRYSHQGIVSLSVRETE